MKPQARSRNHDIGSYFPTFQERVNDMLPASQTSAAPELQPANKINTTPHYLTNDEISQAIAEVEQQAARRSDELIQIHSGLNEQRVARLLGLLDD